PPEDSLRRERRAAEGAPVEQQLTERKLRVHGGRVEAERRSKLLLRLAHASYRRERAARRRPQRSVAGKLPHQLHHDPAEPGKRGGAGTRLEEMNGGVTK